MAGILAVADEAASDEARRYALPAGHDEALARRGQPRYIAPMAQMVVACARPIDAAARVFRTGDGVPFADYGEDLHEVQARFTAPMFDQLLASEWFRRVPDVHERLRARPAGARRRRRLRRRPVEHRDRPRLPERHRRRDRPRRGLDRAGEASSSPGAASRTGSRFHCRDAADPELAGALRPASRSSRRCTTCRIRSTCCAPRARCSPTAARVVVGDERTAERFSLDAGDVERLSTASASSTACRSAWSARIPPGRAP